MNLRQKVKWAKKEIAKLNEQYPSNTTWDIYCRTLREIELQKIIDYKRKPHKMYNWKENYEIDWDNLTYIRFQADFKDLVTLKSPNGRPLTNKQLEEFKHKCLIKLKNHAYKVFEIDIDDTGRGEYLKGKRSRVNYVYVVSNDRTKSKRLHIQYMYYQYEGDDQIYKYRSERGGI